MQQAERLAAVHDPSGKMFNVGEIIILPGAIIKSKAGMRAAAEAKERREREEAERIAAELAYKNAQEAAKLEAEVARKAAEEGRQVPVRMPARIALKDMPKPRKISKKQLQRQELLKPKPVPPKPIIPAGITLPAGEENLLALWDLTDQEIQARLTDQKKQKVNSGKELRLVQQENKKLNKAVKAMKKKADIEGFIFDKAKARKVIIAQMVKEREEREAKKEAASNSGSSSESESDSDSDSESDSEGEKAIHTSTKTKQIMESVILPKMDLTLIEKAADIEAARKAKKLEARAKRRQERRQSKAEDESKAAEETKRLAEAQAAEEAKKLAEVKEAEEIAEAKQVKKAAREAKRAAKDSGESSSSNKRKRSKDEEEPVVEDVVKKEKSHKTKKVKTEAPDEDVAPESVADSGVEKKKKKKSKTEAPVEEVSEPVEESTSDKKKKKKLSKGNDDKLDKEIAAREAKLKGEASDDEPASHGAEQWNPDALTGDASRKDKFLRLLGAGKGASKDTSKKEKKPKHNDAGVDIFKISADLERQFEQGVKMKHDGGAKRRGLGA